MTTKIRASSETWSLVGRDPKTGKGIFKPTVSTPITVKANATTIHHLADGPMTRKEVEELRKARSSKPLPSTIQRHFSTTTTVKTEDTPSELARSLGAAANKPGAAAKASKAYAAQQEQRHEAARPKSTTVRVRFNGRRIAR